VKTFTASNGRGPGYSARALLFFVAAAGIVTGQTNQTITITSVTNRADFQPGLPQPGSLASIFTTGLIGDPGVIWHDDPLSNELNGITVWIASLPAPILGIAFLDRHQRIDLQVPWDAPGDSMDVEVSQDGVSAHLDAREAGSTLFNLSIFFVDDNGYAIVQHSDYTLVTADSPAHPGEYLIAYGINLGPVSNQPLSGSPAPFNPLAVSIPVFPVCSMTDKIRWGALDKVPLAESPAFFVGLTPGTVGVYEVIFQAPSSLPAGDIPISFVRNLAENVVRCPGTGLGTELLTQQGRPVLLPVR
jgi:uncharacterized protein (TIGR03437 family)